uniref:Uncharacterized protein n=1 Tax=Ditylenchus dipsaci TaxID=166011 RepID=A0A915E5W6_9BILA
MLLSRRGAFEPYNFKLEFFVYVATMNFVSKQNNTGLIKRRVKQVLLGKVENPCGFTGTKRTKKMHRKENSTGSQNSTSGSGIRKKILQFGSRVHSHGFGSNSGSSNSGTEMSAKEMQRLEEAKNRLFSSGGGQQTAQFISSPFSHGNTSPLPALRTSLMGVGSANTSSQYSPAMSSESAASTSGLGTDFSYGIPKEFNVPGLSLPALATVNIDVRNLVLQRDPAGDFGFNIRRVQYPLSNNNSQHGVSSAIVFAEPNQIKSGPPRPSDLASILPGDQLLEINGKSIHSMTRDELLHQIQNSGQQIQVKVRAVPELAELCRGGSAGSQRSGRQPEEKDLLEFNPDVFAGDKDGFKETSIAEDERYWLIHSQGYTLCRLIEHLPDSKVRISVASTEIIVDSSDVDRANPPRLDKLGDVAGLKYLNETTTIHLLRQRFGSNLQYTNGGAQNIVCMMTAPELVEEGSKQLVSPAVDPNLVKMFRGCRKSQLPAHIYALAQQVYRNIQVSNRQQSVVFTGCNGSGKSLQLKSFVYYLCEVAGWTKNVPFEKLSLAMSILEAFGNCVTAMNHNSSRFIQLFSLVLTPLLLCAQPKFKHSCWKQVDCYYKRSPVKTHFTSSTIFGLQPFIGKWHGDGSKREKWNHLIDSMLRLGFQQSQIDGIVDILAAIFHLKSASATQGNASKSSFINVGNAEHAASLLGLQLEQLSQSVFRGITPQSSNSTCPSPSSNTLNRFSMSNKSQTGQEALNSFIQALYNELFQQLG